MKVISTDGRILIINGARHINIAPEEVDELIRRLQYTKPYTARDAINEGYFFPAE